MTKLKQTPHERLQRHLDAAALALEAARMIAAELAGKQAIEAKSKQEADRDELAQQAMRLIADCPGLNLTQLRDALGTQHREIRRAVDSLVRNGLVEVTVTQGSVRARLHHPRTQESIDES